MSDRQTSSHPVDAAPMTPSERRSAFERILLRYKIRPQDLSPQVATALCALADDVALQESALKIAEERLDELERLANTDPMLGVLNRRAFTRELERALALAERYGARGVLVFADADGLKTINDESGHAAGDAALLRIARTLSASIRRTDAVGRLGGDEFALILTESDVAAARRKAEMLAVSVAAEPVGPREGWTGEPFTARISCGVVEIRPGASVQETLALADSAMYRIKKAR
jgi:diguanylate cyclase (GGDEF)-like protein